MSLCKFCELNLESYFNFWQNTGFRFLHIIQRTSNFDVALSFLIVPKRIGVNGRLEQIIEAILSLLTRIEEILLERSRREARGRLECWEILERWSERCFRCSYWTL